MDRRAGQLRCLFAPRLRFLRAGSRGAAALVEVEDRDRCGLKAPTGEAGIEGLRIFADGAQVVHGRGHYACPGRLASQPRSVLDSAWGNVLAARG